MLVESGINRQNYSYATTEHLELTISYLGCICKIRGQNLKSMHIVFIKMKCHKTYATTLLPHLKKRIQYRITTSENKSHND